MKKQLFLFFLAILPLVASAQFTDVLTQKQATPAKGGSIGDEYASHVLGLNADNKNQSINITRGSDGNEAYAVYTDDGTLTFYYDSQRDSKDGVVYGLNTGSNTPGWYNKCSQIKKVVFKSSFADARPVSTHCWFEGETNLTDIENIQYLNTSNVTDMSWMFYNCISLTSIDVSGFNTSNVTNMQSMFACDDNSESHLEFLDVSGFDTRKVANMKWMFWNCINLTSLDVSGFVTSNVTDMRGMFGCWKRHSNLTTLDVSGFDTSNVTDMSIMFQYCSYLTSLDLSSFDTSNVTDMGYMFWGCSGLTSLDLKNFDTSNVTNMVEMFEYCSNLINLNVSSFDTRKVRDMKSMFAECVSLENLDVSGFKTDEVTDMNRMFAFCYNINSLDVSGFDTGNVTDMGYMFIRCDKLRSLDISGFDTEKVTDMCKMFSHLSDVPVLDLSGFDTRNVTDMSGMFENCRKLVTIFVSDGWDTGNVSNFEDMFYCCFSLVGSMGTLFDSYHDGGDYACIDGGMEAPGYFTYKDKPDPNMPQISLSIKDWDGILSAFFNSIPNDVRYRLVEKSSGGSYRKVYETKKSHYPNTIMFADYPPADGTYTYFVNAVYIDASGKECGVRSNEVTITFDSSATEEEEGPQFGSIVGRIAFDNYSGIELAPYVNIDVVFSDGQKVRVEPNCTFHRDGVRFGERLTLSVVDDDYFTYKPVTVLVTKDTQNEVQVIEATARTDVNVQVSSDSYDLRIENFVNAAPEKLEMDVINTKAQPWSGVVDLIAFKKKDATKVEQLMDSGVSFSTAKPFYNVGSAYVENLQKGASKHITITITDFPPLKKDEYYKFYFVSKRSEQSMSLTYKTMVFSDKDLHNPMDVLMTKQEPKYKSDKFPEIPDEVDAYLMDVFDTMKEMDKWDGPIGEACERLAKLMEKYERDKDLEGFYGNLPDILKSFKVDLENAVHDVKDFTDVFQKARNFYNQVSSTYNFITSNKTKKDEVTAFATVCKKIFELSGDPLSKIYCMYLDVFEKSAKKILEYQEKLVDAQIDDVFNNNEITFKLKVAHKKEWNDYLTGTRYYSAQSIDDRIKDIEIHMVTVRPKGSDTETQSSYVADPSSGIESWAAYQVDSYDGDAVVLRRDGSRSPIPQNVNYAMVRFWMKILWKNGRVSKIPLYREFADWDVTGQAAKTVITTTLESTTYPMDDKIYLKH